MKTFTVWLYDIITLKFSRNVNMMIYDLTISSYILHSTIACWQMCCKLYVNSVSHDCRLYDNMNSKIGTPRDISKETFTVPTPKENVKRFLTIFIVCFPSPLLTYFKERSHLRSGVACALCYLAHHDFVTCEVFLPWPSLDVRYWNV